MKRFPASATLIVMASLTLLPGLASGAPEAKTAPARQRLRLDNGWRFHRGEAAAAGSVAVTEWRVQPSANAGADAAAVTAPAYNDHAWKPAVLEADAFGGQPGFVWFRANLGQGMDYSAGKHVLHFDSVDDNATVFLNGQQIGRHTGYDSGFDVPLDAGWQKDTPNVVSVLVENRAGTGGLMGPVTLQPAEADVSAAPAAPGYNDRTWRTVHLPHDFVVEGVFTPKATASHGSLPTDIGWYRKTFTVPVSAKGQSVWLDFDGVYRDSQVWLNGKLLGRHPSGYMGFRYDITPTVRYGKPNVLAVRADARAQEGWWYEGGGIYRHVWLNIAAPLHVAPWGVGVTAAVHGSNLAMPDSATVSVQTTVNNSGSHASNCWVQSEVEDKRGLVQIHATTQVSIPAFRSVTVSQTMPQRRPRVWSLEHPTLYTLRTQVRVGKTLPESVQADMVTTPFGIRTIRFDANSGFYLNGKRVEIKGTCNHSDFAGVGIGVPDGLEYWRVRKLKAMGSNAWRMSHNPPTSELLDACDKLGMLVMDENRHLGDTYIRKTPRGTTYSDLSDLVSMVRRDRNHPAVIMWSMCNEEGLQGTDEGARIFTAMKSVVQEYDTTRPVTAAMNGSWGLGISTVEDLQGGNYMPTLYDTFHEAHPAQPEFGSETASTVSTRGIYANDTVRGYVSAYDVNAPRWAQTAEVAWKALADRPYMAGGFVWTGFDYKGEPTPYGWPCINSHFGIMDMCGFPKDNYFYYQAWWGSKPVVHILPHWNWAGKEGQPVSVWAYSNAERVELFLNGKSLGAQAMPPYGHLEWQVPYAPGSLIAKGYTGDKLVATDTVETTGAPAALRLRTGIKTIKADGEDVSPVEVSVVDAQGRVVPTADNTVRFTLTGPAHVAGVGNGDPSSHEPDRASQRRAFNGLCMALVGANDTPGMVTLTASSPGLKAARITLKTLAGEVK